MARSLRRMALKKKKLLSRKLRDVGNHGITYVTPRIALTGPQSMEMLRQAVRSQNGEGEVQFFDTGSYRNMEEMIFLAESYTNSNVKLITDGYLVNQLFADFQARVIPLFTLREFAAAVEKHLSKLPENVAAVVCRDSNTGVAALMISAYLLMSELVSTAGEALNIFGEFSTRRNVGTMTPSQMRYVHYFERSLEQDIKPAKFQMTLLRLVTVPILDRKRKNNNLQFYFQVNRLERDWQGAWEVNRAYDYREHVHQANSVSSDQRFIDLDCSSQSLEISGDVQILLSVYDAAAPEQMQPLCGVWFNTSFVERNYLAFEKSVIDGARQDSLHKVFEPNFGIELFLHRLDATN